MIFAYLLACIPVIIGACLWLRFKEVVWYEWLIGSTIGFFIAGIFHLVAVAGMTSDTETWSGKITKATFHPEWVEKYKVSVYKTESYTDSKGKTHTRRVFSHYETKYRTHQEYWDCNDTLNGNHTISKIQFENIAKNFNSKETVHEFKSGHYSGDENIYVSLNKTGYIYPTTTWKVFENRVKAAPSLFSFSKVPDKATVYPYPENRNPFASDRLLGKAKSAVNLNEWDKMNTRLGPTKKVNVILIGFDNSSDIQAHYQEAKWIGGKKNDLVLCYGNGWSYVFGWTESGLVKQNLQSILLQNTVNTNLIPKIEQEIIKNYKLKDWSKFDYITVEPPTWTYIVLVIVMVLTQAGFWFVSYINEFKKS